MNAPSATTGRWVRIAIGVAFLLLAAWMAYQRQFATANRQEKPPAQQDGAKTGEKASPKSNKSKAEAPKAAQEKSPQEKPKQNSSPKPQTSKPASAKPTEKTNPLLMKGLTLKNEDGEVVYKGDIDLKPTLERIKRGEKFPHRNDGASFGNRERRLPQKPPGYYTEYVVPTPDVRGPGPQRLVIGEEGEVFYTSDHYRTFRRISVPAQLLPEKAEK